MEIWLKNLLPLALMASVVVIPAGVLAAILQDNYGQIGPDGEPLRTWVDAVSFGIDQLVGGLVAAVVIGGVFNRLRKRSAGLFQNMGASFARVPSALGTTLLIALMMAACFVPAILMAWLEVPVGAAIGVIAGLLGILLLLIVTYVAIPATVVERVSPLAAVRRSIHLTAGNRLSIVGLMLLVGLLGMVATFGIVMLLGFLVADSQAGAMVLTYGLAIAIAPVSAVLTAVVYHDLRVAKEGIDTDELASVFE